MIEPSVSRRESPPNAAGTLVVTATSLTGLIILVEATTEFFGFGVNSPIRPTLGNLIAEATSSGIGGYSDLDLGLGWWVWTAPVAVLVMLLICVNLVGDGLDEALNPRMTRG